MKALIGISVLALVLAGCDQLPGQSDAPEVDSAPTAPDVGLSLPAPQEAGDLTIAEPLVSQLEGYWWAEDQSSVETGLGDFISIDRDRIVRVSIVSDSDRDMLHQMGMSDADIDRSGSELIPNQVVRSCVDQTPDVNGRAYRFPNNNSCTDIIGIQNNIATFGQEGQSSTGQMYRVTGEIVERLNAQKEAYLSWRASSQNGGG